MTSYNNYDDVLHELREYGLDVAHLDIDSPKPRRTKITNERTSERKGWYWLSSFYIDNEPFIVGAYGIYRGNDHGKQTIQLPKATRDKLTIEQKEAQKLRQKQLQKQVEMERLRTADKAAERARQMWGKLEQTGQSEYLVRKQIDMPQGIRYTSEGAMVVPMLRITDGSIRGLQFILPKGHPRLKKLGRDKQFWPVGLEMQATMFLIGGNPRDVILVAEGLATAMSLHMSTGYPVAVVWSANNIQPASLELQKKYKRCKILICADDDHVQSCQHCKKYTPVATKSCQHCGKEHGKGNAGITSAQAAAVAINGAWIAPVFPVARPTDKKGDSDFNDLHVSSTLAVVREQINSKIESLGWIRQAPAALAPAGGGEYQPIPTNLSVDDAVTRFWCTYGMGGKVFFDRVERRLVHRDEINNLLTGRSVWEDMRRHPDWTIVRDSEIGFDPAGTDKKIRCNMYGGWPTKPKKGSCEQLLMLLEYLCSLEENGAEVYGWILKWCAYPIQNPGAKMSSALLVHGPQGTGKSRFFEAICQIYGEYGRVIGQDALEDKFNSDWAEKKLFLIGDEVLAREDMYHTKNRLKSFITGSTIRVNPKGLTAHTEANHMNIVFLSNELMPLVLENDDRRHLVMWTPTKMPDEFFNAVTDEINNGGIEALHYHLLHNIDTEGFNEHSRPPMTQSKQQLIHLGLSSEERFLREWRGLEIDGIDGNPLPFCPCLGSHLYRVYEKWCEKNGERRRGMRDLVSRCAKGYGWRAGESLPTWTNLNDKTRKNRKMIVPTDEDMLLAEKISVSRRQHELRREKYDSLQHWMTECFFAFANAIGVENE